MKIEIVREFFQEIQASLLSIFEEIRAGDYVDDFSGLQARIAAVFHDESDSDDEEDSLNEANHLSDDEFDALRILLCLPSAYLFFNDFASFPEDFKLIEIAAPFGDEADEVIFEYRQFLFGFRDVIGNPTALVGQHTPVNLNELIAGLRSNFAEERAALEAELDAVSQQFAQKLAVAHGNFTQLCNDSTAKFRSEFSVSFSDFKTRLDEMKLKYSETTATAAESSNDPERDAKSFSAKFKH